MTRRFSICKCLVSKAGKESYTPTGERLVLNSGARCKTGLLIDCMTGMLIQV